MITPLGDKGGKGSGGTPRKPVEAQNTLFNDSIARFIEVISEGPCEGILGGDKGVFLGSGVPVENGDGSKNFEGISFTQRLGYPDQSPVPGFGAINTVTIVNLEATSVVSPTGSFSGSFDAVRIKVYLDSLTKQNLKNGDLNGSSVEFGVDISIDGGSFYRALTDTISGKTTVPFEKDYRLELPSGTDYIVKFIRISEDFEDVTKKGRTWFSSFTTIIDRKLRFPDLFLSAVTVHSRLFGDQVLPRQYLVKGLILNIPSNYDPITWVYTGIWDGTFLRAWSDNPAWALYEILTNDRWGAGKSLDSGAINRFSLYAIAQYCDELVPDGKGGMERRFTCNCLISSAMDAYSLIGLFTSIFQGMAYWSSGGVQFSQDSPADPKKVVALSNVAEDGFRRSGTSYKSQKTVINVTWRDPAQGYKNAIEVVADRDLIAKYGLKVDNILAFGCTSQGEARRRGLRILDQERYSSDIITYKTGLTHAMMRPGDVIQINDPTHAGISLGGQLAVTGTSTVTLDREIDFDPAKNYTFSVVLPEFVEIDGVPTMVMDQYIPIDNPGGLTATIDLLTDLSQLPLVGASWGVSITDTLELELARVVNIVQVDPHNFEIATLKHDPNKYDRVELGLVIPPPPTSFYPTAPNLPKPTGLDFTEVLYLAGPTARAKAVISWEVSTDPRTSYYELQVQDPFDDIVGWQPAKELSGISYDLLDTNFGQYLIRVRARDNQFRISPWSDTLTMQLDILSRPPSDVTGFKGYVTGEGIKLQWDKCPDLDCEKYEIRYAPELADAEWQNAQVITDAVGWNTLDYMAPGAVGTYLIKAVDQQGNLSLNAIGFGSNMSSMFEFNAMATMTEGPTWDGVGDSVEVDSGSLVLNLSDLLIHWETLSSVVTLDSGSTGGYVHKGVYDLDGFIDLGASFRSRVTYELDATTLVIGNTMATWDTLASLPNLIGTVNDQTKLSILIATSSVDPSVALESDWSDWNTLVINNENERWMRFRLLLETSDPNMSPYVNSVTINCDVPDRVFAQEDLTSSDSGAITVSYPNPFFGPASPAVAISGQGLSSGDYVVLTNKTVDGFDIGFKNSANAWVERTFDYMTRGWGTKNV